MVTTITVNDETHTAAIRKQLEYREKKLKTPSVTDLVNQAAILGMKEIKVE